MNHSVGFLVSCSRKPEFLPLKLWGGEMVKLPFTGVMPDTPTNLPLVRARAMYFLDTNPLAAKAGTG